ncbi:ABC transporter substrate-binding protein [Jiangella mangrovi]|uniref:Multiple sugar transport system substrate-binding protein n=1 Tax=Jiangella mangrovi TaxID=1524084 RepID=A0A7W9GTT9_9ACTN|nr:sugar ABC transporter substrate-binding protein [Jiangella mangrovi]MBB5789668.1 multiple sugar transport system substrate-binding protein [Jiangella mangrovi]
MTAKMLYPTRRVARFGAIALAAAVLVSCSSGSDDESDTTDEAGGGTTTLEYWGWVPGMEDLVATWNEANPDVQVEFHRMTGDDGEKVEAAVDAGSGPDIVQLSSDVLTDYVINDRVQDISEFVGDDESNYTPSSWKAVSVADGVYGLPQGVGPAAMMYRSDIFAAHGIEVPTTWDDYLAAARALHAADPNVVIANLSPTEAAQWQVEVHQNGASLYGTEGDSWKVSVNGAESKEVAQRWQTLLDEGLISTVPMWTPEYWAAVNEGRIATIIQAAWFPALLEENAADTAGNWQVAPMPSKDGQPAAGDTGGSIVVVLRGAENPEAAATFISWLDGSDETQAPLIEDGGLFPSTLNGLESDSLYQPQPFFANQVINEVYADAVQSEPDTWSAGPNFATAFQAIADEFSKVVTGQQTYADALDKAQEATVADLESRGLSVAD